MGQLSFFFSQLGMLFYSSVPQRVGATDMCRKARPITTLLITERAQYSYPYQRIEDCDLRTVAQLRSREHLTSRTRDELDAGHHASLVHDAERPK